MDGIRYIREYFMDLDFHERTHTYRVKGDILPSVSSLIKKYSPKFDEKKISGYVAKRDGIPRTQVLSSWAEVREEACDRGHRVHEFAENYALDRTLIPSCPQERAVKKFWDEMPSHIIPVFMELRMYHKTFQYAGTGDLLLYDTINENFIVADYKTNKDLFKVYKDQRLRFPFGNMLATPYSKYTLQLSYYQLLFEQTGYKVASRKLIWLDLKGEYTIYDLDNCTHILSEELAKRN